MAKTIYQPADGYIIPTEGYEVERDGRELVIRFDIEKIEQVDNSKNDSVGTEQYVQYSANEVRVEYPAEYGNIVSAIVEDKYKSDKMQAIINNYLVSPEEGDHTTAFEEMQAWRSHAKDVAHRIVQV